MTRLSGKGIVVASAIVLALLPQGASAQSTNLDPRWTAWTGCWQAEAPVTEGTIAAAGPTVCVVPASGGSAVEIVTVVDGRVAGRETLAATGTPTRVDRESCVGTITADWSADGRRIYRKAEYTCPGGFQRKSTGIMAMSSTGSWIDVEGLAAGSQEAVRVLRYRPLGGLEGIPAEVASALQGRTFTASTARMSAASDVTTNEVIEASGRVGAGVVEAWLAERGQGFAMELNARRLVQLAEAGVSSRAIDMMVALSYPERFAINRNGNPQVRADERALGGGTDQAFARDPWMYGMGYPGYLGYGYGYGYDSRYGYGNGYGSRYGYGSYYNRPVIVVRGSDQDVEAPQRGRMVNGRGYSGGGNRGSTGEPSSRPSGSSGSSSSGSSGSGSSSGSSGSGSSGGGEVRTAKPRS
ncbi:MAG: hypothetical protein KY464_17305 [Gemmatimonadetes bacterium]|nr:hypothetical protein [Gemmatimonadota bacterium]